MKKIIILSTSLLLTFALGQKQIPGDNGEGKLFDERSNGGKSLAIDIEMIQDIRKIKSTKEKTLIKKQILNGKSSGIKSFKVSKNNSKYLIAKKIIENLKEANLLNRKKSQVSYRNNKGVHYDKVK